VKETKRRSRLFGWKGCKFKARKSLAVKPEQYRLCAIEKLRQRLEEIDRYRLPLSYRAGDESFGRLLRT
jgi:hypothetical protein